MNSIKTQRLILWGIHYIWWGGDSIGRSNYIYVYFYMMVHFTQYTPWVCFVLVDLLYIFPVREWFCHSTIIISVFVLIYLRLLYLCLHWYVCVFCKIYSLVSPHLGNFVLYISCECVIIIPRYCKFLFELICLCILYQCLQWYVYVSYTIYSFVGIHIVKPVLYISWLLFHCLYPRRPEFTIVH